MAETADARFREFAEATKGDDPYRNIMSFISLAYVMEAGESALLDVISAAPTDVRNSILVTFVDATPLESMREAIAYGIQLQLRKKDDQTTLVFEGKHTNVVGVFSGDYELGGELFAVTLTEELRSWRISQFPGLQEPKPERSGWSFPFQIEMPYAGVLYAMFLMSSENRGLMGFGGSTSFSDYFAGGFEAALSVFSVEDGFGNEDLAISARVMFLLRAGLPLHGDFLFLYPHGDVRFGLSMNGEGASGEGAIIGGLAGGVQAMLGSGGSKLLLGVSACIEFFQTDPDYDPMYVFPAQVGNAFFTQPIPTGATIQLFSVLFQEGWRRRVEWLPLSAEKNIIVTAKVPRLYYAGAYVIAFSDDPSKNIRSGDIVPNGPQKELDALKALLDRYRGTDWEPLILALMEELQK